MKIPNKQLCQRPFSKDPSYLLNIFSSVSTQMDCPLVIHQIKSTSVFPEIAVKSKENILYWDMQYWEFYDRFLLELSYLIEDVSYAEKFSDRLSALFYDFLSLKLLHIPELAYCIQVNRERKFYAENEQSKTYNSKTYQLLGCNYESGIFYSRFLVFYHEFFHLYYKNNPNIKIEDCKRLNKLASFYNVQDLVYETDDSDTISILSEGFKTLLNSGPDKLLEEASCDYRALIETISLQRKLTNNSNDKFSNELIHIHNTFHINQTFLSYLTNIFTCWECIYKVYCNVESYDSLIKNSQPYLDKASQMAIIRNSIIPDFLDKLTTQKYNMKSYSSIINEPYIKTAIHKAADKMVDLNFMLYAIEEAIKLSQLPHYNPFELKNIVLDNARYCKYN